MLAVHVGRFNREVHLRPAMELRKGIIGLAAPAIWVKPTLALWDWCSQEGTETKAPTQAFIIGEQKN